jgi:hypothetical protein
MTEAEIQASSKSATSREGDSVLPGRVLSLAHVAYSTWAYSWETLIHPSSAESWENISSKERENWQRIVVAVIYQLMKDEEPELSIELVANMVELIGSVPWPGWGPHKTFHVERTAPIEGTNSGEAKP